jgi:hypothetical protein
MSTSVYDYIIPPFSGWEFEGVWNTLLRKIYFHLPDGTEDHSIILHQDENLKVLQSVEVFGAFLQGVSFIFSPCTAA